jgi:pyridinium-3,5-biscarboxylic acid mononucleotide synthase
MNESDVRQLFEAVKSGEASIEHAVERLRHLPFEDLGFAKIDHHRSLRQGYPEVIFARGKTTKQVVEIVQGMLRASASHNILVTRSNAETFAEVKRLVNGTGKQSAAKVKVATAVGAKAERGKNGAGAEKGGLAPKLEFHELSGAITVERTKEIGGKGLIMVVTAGTSDIPVAEEALVTARIMGNRAEAIYDVGIAGLHRLLEHREKLTSARVIVCVAGMEGALPSVVAGLVAAPVIAVPTSVGYGSSFGGMSALLTMLNSCASNVSVVNIDNGFGGGCVASVINRA